MSSVSRPYRAAAAAIAVFASMFPASVAWSAESVEPVIVSATRSARSTVTVPARISVITRAQIARSGARHIAEVLRGRGGIQLTDTVGDGSRATVNMRGFGESANANVLVLVDGRRLNNTDIAAPRLNDISLKDVERIEIIQGSAGTLFGDQAVGGVVNVITRVPRRFRAWGEVTGGSFSERAVRAGVSSRLRNGVSFRLSGEKRITDNYRDNNDQDYRNFLGRVAYDHDRGTVFAEYQRVFEALRLAGRLTAADIAANPDRRQTVKPNDFADSNTRVTRLGVRHQLGDHWSFEGEWTYRKTEGFARLEFFGANSDTPQVRRQRSINPRMIGAYPLGHGDLIVTLGADLDDAGYSTVNTFFGATTATSNRQDMRGIYAQAVVPVSAGVDLTLGARYAEVENALRHSTAFPAGTTLDDDQWVTEIGVSAEPAPGWRVFLRRDENFRFAKVDEQTFTSPGVIGLKTQTGTSWEAGAGWEGRRGNVSATLYRLDLDDEIAFDPTAPDPFGTFFGANVNFDSTSRRGLILEGDFAATRSLSVGGGFAWTDAEFDSGVFSGKKVSDVARRSWRIAADYRFDAALSGHVEVLHTGSRYLSGDNANLLPRQPGYSVVNLALAYRAAGWTAGVRVNNLGDKSYNDVANAFGAFFPAPERNVQVTLGYEFD